MPTLVQDATNVVVKGPFNPGIFSPSWLYINGVIGSAEHENSKVSLITPDFAKFECVWLDVTITQDTLQMATARVDEFERLRDAVIATISLLPHVPVAVMGFNRSAHFDVGGVDEWHRVGDQLAPKGVWNDILKLPGMKSLTLWSVRPDTHSGRIQVTVEPSSILPVGIFVSHNDHYNLVSVESQPSTRDEFFSQGTVSVEPELGKREEAISLLQSDWTNSLDRAAVVMGQVYKIGTSASSEEE